MDGGAGVGGERGGVLRAGNRKFWESNGPWFVITKNKHPNTDSIFTNSEEGFRGPTPYLFTLIYRKFPSN